jgi:hypothetical protein
MALHKFPSLFLETVLGRDESQPDITLFAIHCRLQVAWLFPVSTNGTDLML